MDGARRILQSLGGSNRAGSSLAYGGAGLGLGDIHRSVGDRLASFWPRGPIAAKIRRIVGSTFVTHIFPVVILATAFFVAATQSGAYKRFLVEVGAPGDILARTIGFGVARVTISGISEIKESDVLLAAGVKARNSLPYLDATAIRERLLVSPLVKDVEVKKLYPDRLTIAIVERRPFAIWQNKGDMKMIAEDGVAIGALSDPQYSNLPLVVGDNANRKIHDYMQLVDAVGALGSPVKAGVLVSQRRWNLVLANGLELKLPEENPQKAIETLARLDREQHILSKDIISLDLRQLDRIIARLPDDVAAQRLEAIAALGKGRQ